MLASKMRKRCALGSRPAHGVAKLSRDEDALLKPVVSAGVPSHKDDLAVLHYPPGSIVTEHRAVAQVEFLANAVAVGLDGRDAQVQSFSDLRSLDAFTKQPEHL